jgi:hypothetical protein
MDEDEGASVQLPEKASQARMSSPPLSVPRQISSPPMPNTSEEATLVEVMRSLKAVHGKLDRLSEMMANLTQREERRADQSEDMPHRVSNQVNVARDKDQLSPRFEEICQQACIPRSKWRVGS